MVRWSVVALCALALVGCSGGPSAPAGGTSAAPASGSAPAGGAAPAQATTGGAPAAPLRQITVAHGFISAETLPIWIAQEVGLYEKYGLQASAIPLQTGAQVVPAMTADEVQIALITGLAVIEAGLSGADLVVVAGYSNWMRYFLHARPEIQRVEDLRGKRIGITRRGGAIRVAVEILLARHGLTAGTDASLVELGTAANQISGLAAGAVDAAVVALPTNLIAEREGFPFIEDTKQHNIAFLTNAVAVRRPYLAANPDVVKRYLQAHIEAVEIARRDKALAKRVLGRHTDTTDEELLERTYQVWISDLVDVPHPSPEAIQGVIDTSAGDRPEARNAKPADFYDERPMRELEQSGFMRQVRGS
jgi:NitT/TauT family transport system substrate-binding protein